MQTTFYGLQFFYEEEVEFPEGHTLLLEGRKQNHLYVLRKGAVEISKSGQRVAVVKHRGELFGEISALLGTENGASVKTLEPSKFFVIEDANAFLADNPRTTLYVAKLLAARLAHTTEDLQAAKKNALKTMREL